MFFRLLFLLTIVPFVELYFLIRLSGAIGFSNTLLLVIVTGVVGAWLLKKQGHSILMEIQQQTRQNKLPSDAIAKGFMTFVGGLLLLTPGVLTDVIGLSLIFPVTQLFWKSYFKKQWKRGIDSGSVQFYSNTNFDQNPFHTKRSNYDFKEDHSRRMDNVIDIEAKSKSVEKDED
jgi:UPF0716 protein FxsA